MEATFKQKQLKPGTQTGSFINMLMSSNSTLPEVGKGATLLSWTDRHAYEVMSVSEDYKTVVIQKYQPERMDDNGMSECQEYKYEKLTGVDETIVWRYGSWYKRQNVVVFENGYEFDRSDEKELFDENGILQIVQGKTKTKVEYSKVNILWGVKEEYYDFSF